MRTRQARSAVVPVAIRETVEVRHRSPFRPAESLIAEGLGEGGMDMFAAFAGIGLVFIAVVVLSAATMIYVMVRQA